MTGVTLRLDLDASHETLRLATLEVYNWGPFSGFHRAHFSQEGTALIGPTGSGKTTLVDALMTLLVAQPSYNLASTGGNASDRDLESYVRGVLGPGTVNNDTSHISRPAKTVTGLAATFSRPGRSVMLGAVLWTDTASRSASDIKKRWLISEADGESLENWLTIRDRGGDRALKKHGEGRHGLALWESKTKYLAAVRRLFEVSDNALRLLNRASGLKQLDSIDHLFRDLVLDDKSAFKQAKDVVDNFQQLAEIRQELDVARRQHDSLRPLRKLDQDYQATADKLSRHQQAKAAIRVWYAIEGQRRWAERCEQLNDKIDRLERQYKTIKRESEQAERALDELRAEYQAAGGATIDSLRARVRNLEETVRARQQTLDDHRSLAASIGIELESSSAEDLAEAQRRAATVGEQLNEDDNRIAQQFTTAAAAHGRVLVELANAESELAEAEANPGSSLPGRQLRFRAELAAKLGLNPAELPFVAELVEVDQSEARWRGAIERAIGGHRTRLLVDEDRMASALRWVNDRDNRIHVRLERAASRPAPRQPFADSFIHKLNFKPHRHQEAALALLASIDRHCLERPEDLTDHEHAMTVEGLLSGRTGRFEKPDQRRLNEGWQTGFDNTARVDELAALLDRLNTEATTCGEEFVRAEAARDGHKDQTAAVGKLAELSFEQIDVATPTKQIDDLLQQIDRLADPTSALAKVGAMLASTKKQLKELGAQAQEVSDTRAVCRSHLKDAEEAKNSAAVVAKSGLSDADMALVEEIVSPIDHVPLTKLPDHQTEEVGKLADTIKTLATNLSRLDASIERQMDKALAEDTGELVDAAPSRDFIDQYLERLATLTEEDLPRRQERFLRYLNQSSDEGVASLLAQVDAEVEQIEIRIDELNKTLHRVDFERGRYLELRPRRVTQAKVLELEKARKTLASARLKDDSGETQYRALQAVVEHLSLAYEARTTQWARSVLDPRHRLSFMVAVVDRDSGEAVEERTSSEGGSGGEKEIIASYVLTASLAYALCPEGAAYPLFGTVVLDEAFSKSSAMRAARIIEALEAFGLHPLFVTPNKELRLLRANTRSAILVNRHGPESRLLAVTWEELDRRRPQPTDKADAATA